jgi:mannosyltransferase
MTPVPSTETADRPVPVVTPEDVATGGTTGGTAGWARNLGTGEAWPATVLVVLAAAAWFSFRVDRPGVWRDELATLVACGRPLPDLFALAGHVDLVHLAYYLPAKAVWAVVPSVTAVRMLSVVAMALTAGVLVRIGTALGSRRLGLIAGVLLVVNPFAARYAQEARPFAAVALAAALATLVLLRLLGATSVPARRRAARRYVVAVVALGLLNVLALLLLTAAHAVVVAAGPRRWADGTPARPRPVLVRPRRTVGEDGTGAVSPLRRWLPPAATGLLLVGPFVLATFAQRSQVAWIEPPHLYDIRALVTLQLGSRPASLLVPALVVLLLLGPVLAARRRPDRDRPRLDPARRAALVLGLAWVGVPVVLLFAVSRVIPLWDAHYLLFTAPGVCLALAAAVPAGRLTPAGRTGAAGVAAAVAAVLVVAALGAGAQAAAREPLGHDADLAAVAKQLGDRARPGDAAVLLPADLRPVLEVYRPEVPGLARLADPMVSKPAWAADNLNGTPVPTAAVPAVLAGHHRIWLVQGLYAAPVLPGSPDDEVAFALRAYRPAETVTVADVRITLMTDR